MPLGTEVSLGADDLVVDWVADNSLGQSIQQRWLRTSQCRVFS